MSYIETPQETTVKFIDTWRTQDANRLTAELVSIHKETNRQADNYSFEVTEGLLIDPETKRPILDFIAKGVEYEIAEKLQTWASKTDEGLAYWVSPRVPGLYPCDKIIIHRISNDWNGGKHVLNSTILFDAELENPDELRSTLFTIEDKEENIFKLLSWVKEVSNQNPENSGDSEKIVKTARYFADKIRSGVSDYLIVEEMKQLGFLGERSISCGAGQTFSQLIDSNSSVAIYTKGSDHMGSLTFTCPACGKENTRAAGQLLELCQNVMCPDRKRVRC